MDSLQKKIKLYYSKNFVIYLDKEPPLEQNTLQCDKIELAWL
jgi:hypothetical protein